MHLDEVSVREAIQSDVAAVPAATAGTRGVVLKAATVAHCVPAADGTSAGTQLNALIDSLKAAGVVA